MNVVLLELVVLSGNQHVYSCLLFKAQWHVDSYKLEQVGSSAGRWLKSRASGGDWVQTLSCLDTLGWLASSDLTYCGGVTQCFVCGRIQNTWGARQMIQNQKARALPRTLMLEEKLELVHWTPPPMMTLAPWLPHSYSVSELFQSSTVWCCWSRALESFFSSSVLSCRKCSMTQIIWVLSNDVISLSAPSRWLLAAQRCASALWSLWFALQELALCQMDVGAARCAPRSLTRTAATQGLATTTKGWSVITATTWPWPGASVEVREEGAVYAGREGISLRK